MKCIREREREIKSSYYEDAMSNNFDITINEIIKEYDNGKITKKYRLEEKQPGTPYWFIIKESRVLEVVLKCFNDRIKLSPVSG